MSAPQDPQDPQADPAQQAASPDGEIVPTENWTPERVFDSSDFLDREAPVYLDAEEPMADPQASPEDAKK